MRYAAPISALALATAALGQTVTVIHVGNNSTGKGTFFSPSSVTASQGDIITFVFDTVGSNHTVSQSTFGTPCEPSPNGFDSGYIPGPATAGDPVASWNLTITDTSHPIWFYCAQPNNTHCEHGMVGAINPPASTATNNLSAFVALASSATTIGQPTPALVGSGASASIAPLSGSAPASSAAATGSGGATTSGSAASSTSAAPPAQTTNAAAGSVGANGLSWAVAAVFGVALL